MSRNPETVSDVLALVQKLLDAAKPKNAIELIQRQGTRSAELTNAYGVALMRAGETAKALEVYRNLCINESGLLHSAKRAHSVQGELRHRAAADKQRHRLPGHAARNQRGG